MMMMKTTLLLDVQRTQLPIMLSAQRSSFFFLLLLSFLFSSPFPAVPSRSPWLCPACHVVATVTQLCHSCHGRPGVRTCGFPSDSVRNDNLTFALIIFCWGRGLGRRSFVVTFGSLDYLLALRRFQEVYRPTSC